MSHRLSALILVVAMVVLVPAAGVAAPIKYHFSGSVASIDGTAAAVSRPLGTVGVGDRFTGTFWYSYDRLPASLSDDAALGIYGTAESAGLLAIDYTLKFGGTHVGRAPGTPLYLLVTAGSLRLLDNLPRTSAAEWCDEFELSLQLAGEPFAAGGLPRVLDPLAFLRGGVNVDWFAGEPGGDFFSVYGTIDTIRASSAGRASGRVHEVPEPAVVLLVGCGLFGLTRVTRRLGTRRNR